MISQQARRGRGAGTGGRPWRLRANNDVVARDIQSMRDALRECAWRDAGDVARLSQGLRAAGMIDAVRGGRVESG